MQSCCFERVVDTSERPGFSHQAACPFCCPLLGWGLSLEVSPGASLARARGLSGAPSFLEGVLLSSGPWSGGGVHWGAWPPTATPAGSQTRTSLRYSCQPLPGLSLAAQCSAGVSRDQARPRCCFCGLLTQTAHPAKEGSLSHRTLAAHLAPLHRLLRDGWVAGGSRSDQREVRLNARGWSLRFSPETWPRYHLCCAVWGWDSSWPRSERVRGFVPSCPSYPSVGWLAVTCSQRSSWFG